MTHFNQVVYDANAQQVTVGAGLTWDTVYSTLAPFNRTVVGGRIQGVGVAGFILGGGAPSRFSHYSFINIPTHCIGFSYLTSRYGFAIDNMVAFELVLPNGTVTTVTPTSSPDLWFGVRGGYNNFVSRLQCSDSTKSTTHT